MSLTIEGSEVEVALACNRLTHDLEMLLRCHYSEEIFLHNAICF